MAHGPMALWPYGLVALMSIYGHYAFSVVCSPRAGRARRSVLCGVSYVAATVSTRAMQIMDSSTELEVSSCSDGTDSDYGTASFLDNRR